MVATSSNMVPLGTTAPAFMLPDTVSGESLTLEALRGQAGTLIMFICNHCPFVKHVQAELVRLAHDYVPRGVSVIAISSNDAETYPQDAPAAMTAEAHRAGYTFPYLYDATQAVGHAYAAACTPDFFLYDAALQLAYRGRLDASTPGNREPVTGADLRGALEHLLSGLGPVEVQHPSIGCNIKWRSSPGA